jgi:hypothetical protein
MANAKEIKATEGLNEMIKTSELLLRDRNLSLTHIQLVRRRKTNSWQSKYLVRKKERTRSLRHRYSGAVEHQFRSRQYPGPEALVRLWQAELVGFWQAELVSSR